MSETPNDLPGMREKENFDVKATVDNIQVPMKGGSPAFSIHASKVYILYPSLFQDPNIFGRFSIPQNINLDPLNEKSTTAKTNVPTNVFQQPSYSSDYGDFYPQRERKLFRRQADSTPQQEQQQPQEAKPNPRKGEKKRNVETHLTGTIVVKKQQ